jgi:hypothetical protein
MEKGEEKGSSNNEVADATVGKASCVKYFDALWFCYCEFDFITVS